MGFLLNHLKERFEQRKREVQLFPGGTIMMISGCEDAQTSADVSDVGSFQLPDPAGRAGGACTSTLLNILYADNQKREDDLSFVQVLAAMRENLQERGFEQIPQLSSSAAVDVNRTFDLVPDGSTGTRRALLIGINYVGHEQGQLSGCHNDVKNMIEYIKDVHGFEEDNITVLMDDGEHTEPTKENMMAAYAKIVEDSEPGDAIFLHYSGHGARIKDDDGNEEADGHDESLVPLDYNTNGVIRDDDLFSAIIKPLKSDVCLTAIMDCCHSGSVLDLPYLFKADGNQEGMEIDEAFDFDHLFGKIGGFAGNVFENLADDVNISQYE
jgi:metacaspase-1